MREIHQMKTPSTLRGRLQRILKSNQMCHHPFDDPFAFQNQWTG